jgi:hypothetical protein
MDGTKKLYEDVQASIQEDINTINKKRKTSQLNAQQKFTNHTDSIRTLVETNNAIETECVLLEQQIKKIKALNEKEKSDMVVS